MTTPSIVSGHSTAADTVNATSRTINAPTYSAGNVVLLAVVTDAASGTISSPHFADYIFQDRPIKTAGGSTVALASVMWKVALAAGSEGSTYTIDTSASERVGAICFAVADAEAAIHAATETNGDSGTATLPAIITTVADCLRISIVGADGTTQTTPHGTATNHTKLGEAWATSSGAVSAHYKTISSPTTDGAETSTLAASFRWIGFSIALAPAVAV
ncbi:MAG: hypothetical protein E6R03_02700 [Hyphomicrobiaceae bacterium]|nr:MAG: hypothetical protein E6R03_02700 [Hyphomicrobiaceae bacterium]